MTPSEGPSTPVPSRPLTIRDAPDLTSFLARTDRRFGNAPERDEPQVRDLLAAAERAGSPALAVLSPTGRLRGVAAAWTTALLRLAPAVPADTAALDRLLGHLGRVAPNVPLWVPSADLAVRGRLEAAGWEFRYTDIQMRRDLRDLPPQPAISDVEVTEGRSGSAAPPETARTVRELIDATWGSSTSPEEFEDRFLRAGAASRDLWMLGWAGAVLVAAALGRFEDTPDGPIGHVTHLDVLPSHQGRGLGPLVLGRLLRAFAAAGLETAQLGVHRDNRSGAPDLYRRLGWRDISWQDRWHRASGPAAARGHSP